MLMETLYVFHLNQNWLKSNNFVRVCFHVYKPDIYRPSQVSANSLPLHQLQPDIYVKLSAVLNIFMISQWLFAGMIKNKYRKCKDFFSLYITEIIPLAKISKTPINQIYSGLHISVRYRSRYHCANFDMNYVK